MKVCKISNVLQKIKVKGKHTEGTLCHSLLSLHTSAVNHDECCMSHVLKQSRFTVQL